jgi:hypothetical protein
MVTRTTLLAALKESKRSFVIRSFQDRRLAGEDEAGCQFEKRQLESAHSLLNALAILTPVAWRLLLLRHLARSDTRAPASSALTLLLLELGWRARDAQRPDQS